MSTISFRFELKPIARTTKNINNKIVIKDIKLGIVWIDKDANYYVRIYNNKKSNDYIDYLIAEESHNCKNKETVYKLVEKGLHVWIRNKENLCELSYIWKPFKPGLIVRGTIEKQNDIEVFKIKDEYRFELCTTRDFEILNVDPVFYISHITDARAFYKENYKIIQQSYNEKYKPEE